MVNSEIWPCGVSERSTGKLCSVHERQKDKEELRRLVGVEPITTVIRSSRLRWYGHVMRKHGEDWVKKCMEFRVDGRRPVGSPRRTWLVSVGYGRR